MDFPWAALKGAKGHAFHNCSKLLHLWLNNAIYVVRWQGNDPLECTTQAARCLGAHRSSHLEEYTRSRPASAGGRPRSLLNKMANAAVAVQLDDDDEPADAEPWVLEGWGDGPSVVRLRA